MTDELTVRAMQATSEDLALLEAVFEANGSPKDPRTLRWRYLDNPTGELVVQLAIAGDGCAAAVYCVSPVTFDVDGQTVLGVQSIDTLTDAGFRGRGLFRRLAASTYERSADVGAALVYGFPNGNSAHGFFERLGWTRLDPVPFLVRPLRSRYFLQRALPKVGAALPDVRLPVGAAPRLPQGHELRVVLEFGAEFDALWERARPARSVAVRRDAKYLSWRLLQNPTRYKSLGYYVRGELCGFVSFRVVDKHGGRIGYVLELLAADGDPDIAARLLRVAVREMADAGADALLAWCLGHSPQRRVYRGRGFVPMPERVRPIELHFGVRGFVPSSGVALANRESWYLSYCDSDTV